MVCRNCGKQINENEKFCMYCGAGIKPVKKEKVWIEILLACALSALMVGGFLVYIFVIPSGEEKQKESDSKEEEIVTSIKFQDEKYALSVKCAEDMSNYLVCSNIDKKQVQWSADSPDVEVGSNGMVAIQDYNVTSNLTAKSKDDEKVVAVCQISSLSEQKDFQNKVADYNAIRTEDEKMEDGTVAVCNKNGVESKIDVQEINHKPKKASAGKSWDSGLFYSLEDVKGRKGGGKINNYLVERKQFINSDTGNVMEYEVYRNPDNDKINKIVSIEHMDGMLDIREYYYTNKRKVNFILSYQDSNYLPNYANADIHGERYLFDDDSMVTWRIVKSRTSNINYCRTKKERKRLRENGWPKLKMYSELSNAKKEKYNKLEKEMLNAAYNTLKKICEYEGISTIRGQVGDESAQPLENVKVGLHSDTYDCDIYSGRTNKKGYYKIYVPSQKGSYRLTYQSENGNAQETLYNLEVNTDDLGIDQDTVYLTEETGENMYQFQFLDATKNASDVSSNIYNASITFRRGGNNYSGAAVATAVTGESGDYESIVNKSLPSGMYTIESKCTGFMTEYRNVFLSSVTQEQFVILMTPQLADNEMRIVLDWGAYPQDEDSHLFMPSGEQICYYSKEVYGGYLDVDDVDGYGPETITLTNLENGVYKYYVADYTHCSTNEVKSTALSESGATVRVYTRNGLEKTFYVPKNQKGVIWEVFSIRNKKIVPIQRYYDSIEDKKWCSKRY